jgi:AmmeMemoRadiSam system protein A
MGLDAGEGLILLAVARRSIDEGLLGRTWLPDAADYPAPLRAPGAAFVTLTLAGRLRGCIGSLEPRRPLVVEVAGDAFSAAFSDPRFDPLEAAEAEALELSVSVLGPTRAMTVTDEADLQRQLRPGRDGLVLLLGSRRSTFLPSVWEELPRPEEFLAHLKLKAGLPADYWSADFRFERYAVEEFPAA